MYELEVLAGYCVWLCLAEHLAVSVTVITSHTDTNCIHIPSETFPIRDIFHLQSSPIYIMHEHVTLYHTLIEVIRD